MEVILKQDVQGLGYTNDVVKVKPGYGRNYLIPQGLAILANTSNRKKVEEKIRQTAHKAEKKRNDALALSERIGDITLEIGAKVGESGKIFGAVTTLQISDALRERGFEVDRRQISLPVQPKEIGEFTALLDLHKDVKKEVRILVVPE